MKGVGEPCAGEPHARFDGRGLETERHRVTAPAPDPTTLRSSARFDLGGDHLAEMSVMSTSLRIAVELIII